MALSVAPCDGLGACSAAEKLISFTRKRIPLKSFEFKVGCFDCKGGGKAGANARYERFAQIVADGKLTPTAAYRETREPMRETRTSIRVAG